MGFRGCFCLCSCASCASSWTWLNWGLLPAVTSQRYSCDLGKLQNLCYIKNMKRNWNVVGEMLLMFVLYFAAEKPHRNEPEAMMSNISFPQTLTVWLVSPVEDQFSFYSYFCIHWKCWIMNYSVRESYYLSEIIGVPLCSPTEPVDIYFSLFCFTFQDDTLLLRYLLSFVQIRTLGSVILLLGCNKVLRNLYFKSLFLLCH